MTDVDRICEDLQGIREAIAAQNDDVCGALKALTKELNRVSIQLVHLDDTIHAAANRR